MCSSKRVDVDLESPVTTPDFPKEIIVITELPSCTHDLTFESRVHNHREYQDAMTQLSTNKVISEIRPSGKLIKSLV